MLPSSIQSKNNSSSSDEGSFQPVFKGEQQNDQLLDLIVNSAPIGIALASVESQQIVHSNRAYRDLLGYSVEELKTLTFTELTHPDDLAIDEYHFAQILENKVSEVKFEKRMRTKHHDWVWVKVTLSITRDAENSQPIHSLAMVEDISEQKRIFAALEASESRFRAIVEALPDAIFHTNREGCYLDYFPGNYLKTFVPAEGLIGKTIHEILPSSVAQSIQSAIDQAFATHQIQTCTYELPSDTGSHHYEARIMPCSNREALAIVRDITLYKEMSSRLMNHNEEIRVLIQELHQTQKKLKQAEGLATLGSIAASSAIEFRRYLSQISREFARTFQNMQALLTIVSLYEQYYPFPPEPIEAEREYIQPDSCLLQLPKASKLIKNRIKRADEFAQFVQTLAENPQPTTQLIDLHTYIDHVLQGLQTSLKAQNIQVKRNYQTETTIKCHSRQFYQALVHLGKEIIELFVARPTRKPILTISTKTLNNGRIRITFETNVCHLSHQTEEDPMLVTQPELSLTKQIVETIHQGKLIFPNLSRPNPQFAIELPAPP
ncbi:PAS domain S-box protein [Leptolyngbya sp. AN03gr2]|uniref:PAS domain S-box protein n=1 Tax=unclassified Leptolyngbya TaxID=2650499 RepID=UPI003D31F0FE